jgi:iron(III) transport system substrate-binding protein
VIRGLAAVFVAALLVAACTSASPDSIRLYTSVTQETIDALVERFEADHADVEVEVFRAPTGELAARIAAELREGGLQADVLWLTDPLSMQQYDADGLLRSWRPAGAAAVPDWASEERFWGTRILKMVIVHGGDTAAPTTWSDLTSESYRGRIAIPDPGFAGSALAVLGYFATSDAYGFDFYRSLRDNGAVQLASPGEVVTGVAEGRFDAGITLEFSARAAIEKGSPITIVRPGSGAIAIYSPIAVTSESDAPIRAEAFVELVLSTTGQELIAATGWEPIRDDVAWADRGPLDTIDWSVLADRREELLASYRELFGG